MNRTGSGHGPGNDRDADGVIGPAASRRLAQAETGQTGARVP